MHRANKYILDSTQQNSSWCCKFNQKTVQNQPQPNIPLRQPSHPTSKSKNKIQITSRSKQGINSKSFKKVHQLCPKKTLQRDLKIKARQSNYQPYIYTKPPNQTQFFKFQKTSIISPQKYGNRKAPFFDQIQKNRQHQSPPNYYQKKHVVIHQLDKKQQFLYNCAVRPQRHSQKKITFFPKIDNEVSKLNSSIYVKSPEKQYNDFKYLVFPEAIDKKYSFLYSTMNCTIHQRTARGSTVNLQQSLLKKPLTLSRKNRTQLINPEEDDKILQQAVPTLIKLNSITKNDRIREVQSQFDSQDNIHSEYSEIVKEESDFFRILLIDINAYIPFSISIKVQQINKQH